jgi:hypothetical protein
MAAYGAFETVRIEQRFDYIAPGGDETSAKIAGVREWFLRHRGKNGELSAVANRRHRGARFSLPPKLKKPKLTSMRPVISELPASSPTAKPARQRRRSAHQVPLGERIREEDVMKTRKTCGETILRVVGLALLLTGLPGTMPGKALADPSGFVFTKLATIPGPAPGAACSTSISRPGLSMIAATSRLSRI